MSAEQLERKRQLEALWVRHLDGDTGAADELAAALRPGGPLADALAADEGLHRMLGGLGRAGADTDAFVARVESLVAAEASGERFVRAVEARIQAPARRRRRWLPWSLVFAPGACRRAGGGGLAAGAPPSAGDQRPAPTATAAAPGAGRVTVVLGSLATPAPAGKRLVPGQTVPAGLTLASDQGRACLRLGDGSRLCLERASRLRLDDGGGTEPRLSAGGWQGGGDDRAPERRDAAVHPHARGRDDRAGDGVLRGAGRRRRLVHHKSGGGRGGGPGARRSPRR